MAKQQAPAARVTFRARLALSLAVLFGRLDHLITMNREQRRAMERGQGRAR